MKRPSPALNDRQFAFAAACVFVAVLAHVAHLPAAMIAVDAAVMAAAWFARSRARVVPFWIRIPLIVLLPLLVILHYGNVFGREAGTALVCGMISLKLLETTTRRDARAIVCFASFVLMSALLFDTSLGFTVVLFAALALPLATLRELEPRPSNAVRMRVETPLSNLRRSAIALLAAVPLGLCVFVFFPRLESPMWRAPGDEIARTGLGDSMAPGSMQNLLIDDSAAFRVAFDGQPPTHQKLYWRGPVLVDFDGTTWTRRETATLRPGAEAFQFSGQETSYEITLEPNDKPWLLALDAPLDVPKDTRRASDLTLVRRWPVGELLRYRMRSALDYRLDLQLSELQRGRALALPPGFDPRSIELARGWRRDSVTDEAVIAQALKLFHDSFSYTLLAPELGRDSIDDFLFGTKRGFCEHFSAAFVFLMRAAGIPARVVTGYQGGYFNKVGGYLLVRQSDAHAWAEVWLAGKGWTRVDPTAAVSPRRIEYGAMEAAGASSRWYQTDWIRALRNQIDLVNRGWNSAFVQFNALRQQNLLTPLGIEKADYMQLTWVLVGSSSLLLLAAAFWVMRAPRRVADPLDAAYAALCAKLARAGVLRARAEGPVDFAARVPEPAVRDLLSRYVALRYASAMPAADAVATFARAARRWRPPSRLRNRV